MARRPSSQIACCAEIQKGPGQRGQSAAIKPANPSTIVFRDWPNRTLDLAQNQHQLTRFPTLFPHRVQVRVSAPLRQVSQRGLVGHVGVVQGLYWHRVGEDPAPPVAVRDTPGRRERAVRTPRPGAVRSGAPPRHSASPPPARCESLPASPVRPDRCRHIRPPTAVLPTPKPDSSGTLSTAISGARRFFSSGVNPVSKPADSTAGSVSSANPPVQICLGVLPAAGQTLDGMAVVELVKITTSQLFRTEGATGIVLLFS